MKKHVITIPFEVFDHRSELPEEIRNLLNKAQQARESAYAPYSHFKVGAAILLESGEIITGNNQENAAYPSGLCAERVAAYHAASNFPNQKMIALAVVVEEENTTSEIPATPCGSCRQSLFEFEQKQHAPLSVYCMAKSGKIVKISSVSDLLPFGFGPDSL